MKSNQIILWTMPLTGTKIGVELQPGGRSEEQALLLLKKREWLRGGGGQEHAPCSLKGACSSKWPPIQEATTNYVVLKEQIVKLK